MRSDSARLLAIYLRDHDGAAAGGVRAARRFRDENRDTPFGAELAALASAIEQDREALDDVRTALGIGSSPLKRVTASVLAAAAALKLNGRLIRYSPLSRVVEVEALSSAVTAKLRLWDALLIVAAHDDRLDSAHLASLRDRAKHQLDVITDLHARAVTEAFIAPDPV